MWLAAYSRRASRRRRPLARGEIARYGCRCKKEPGPGATNSRTRRISVLWGDATPRDSANGLPCWSPAVNDNFIRSRPRRQAGW